MIEDVDCIWSENLLRVKAAVQNSSTWATARTEPSYYMSVVLFVLLILIPIFATSDPRLWLYITLSALISYLIPRIKNKHANTKFRFWLMVPFSSACVAYAAGGGKESWHKGLVTVSLLLAGLSLGSISTDSDKKRFLRSFNVIICISAIIAISEFTEGKPFFAFSPLQEWSPFRASGLLGHPLILATTASAAVAVSLIMPRIRKFPLLLSAGLPAVGAVSSVSRSLIYLLTGAVMISLFVRNSQKKSRRKTILIASIFGIFMILQSPLSASLDHRFTNLSSAEQATRLNAPHVTNAIVTGYKQVIGGGPGYVPFALSQSPTLLRENHGYNTLDNGFLGVYANYGALGSIGYLFAIGMLVMTLRRKDAALGQRYAAVFGLIFVLANISFEALNWELLLFLLAWSLGAAAKTPVQPVDDVLTKRGTARVF